MRILILIAIGLLLYVVISNLLRKIRQEESPQLNAEKMVKCAHCGLHILENEAIKSGQQYFCSQQHLDEHNQ
jgi:uncharacterized protein